MKLTIMLLNTFLLSSILTVFISCSGQPNPVANGVTLTTAIGDTVSLLDKTIYCVFQDRKNNFWFGSNGEGLYRYDGKNLIHFTTKNGLTSNQIRGIQEDKLGNIYFGTANGVSKFDGAVFTTLNCVISSSPDAGWRLHPDDLWFQGAQDSGLVYRYDGSTLYRLQFPKTKAYEDFVTTFPRSQYPQMTFNPYDVYCIYKDRNGSLWFGTNIGLCRYDGKTFDWMSEKELGIDAIAFHVRSTIEDRNGDFWFSNTMHRFKINLSDATHKANGTINFKADKGITVSQSYNANDFAYFMSGVEDSNGDLWLVTYSKGVWLYDGKTMTHYSIKNGDADVTLFSIYKDRQGALWLGTHTAGAYKFNGKEFEKFR